MSKIRPRSFFSGQATVLGALVCAVIAGTACGDDAADKLNGRGGFRGGPGDPNDPNDPNNPNNPNRIPEEEKLFRALEADLVKTCGKGCHDAGTFPGAPPTFLAPPDAYKSIKAAPGIITREIYDSALLTKPAHAGPPLNENQELETKVTDWLKQEALAIQAAKLPSTDPITINVGPNDIDLTKAATGGLANVHLKFEAAIVGTSLSLTKMFLVVPVGTDVHILQPRFIRVIGNPQPDGPKEVADPADSFSNLDQTAPAGKETALGNPPPPNGTSVLFSGDGWRGYDMAADKIRIEAVKLEPGKVQVIDAAKTCKDVNAFTANVLPNFRGQGGNAGAPLVCSNGNCHGAAAVANMNFAGNDNALICQQVLSKLNQANIGQSLIVTKVTQGPHGGGTVGNAAGWSAVFTQNAGAFF